ncbi:MAG: gliding motility-associated C-terminal domain-containing protein [Flavobacteriaceae bacterium]
MKKFFPLLLILITSNSFAQEQVILNIDFTKTKVYSTRAELFLELNKGENFNAEIWIEGHLVDDGVESSDTSNTLIESIYEKVDDVSVEENFNLKVYEYVWQPIFPLGKYKYRWILKSEDGWEIETDWQFIEAGDGFGVLPNQDFEIPEEGLIPGDTIGVVVYENSFEKWQKVQTYYKTTFAQKPNGELYGWGRNQNNSTGAFSREGEGVVYGQARVTREPFTRSNHDYDLDGFMDEDEYLSGTDVFDPNDFPSEDSDGDFLSDVFEEYKGLNPDEPWLGGRMWFDWMYPMGDQGRLQDQDVGAWWENYDWDTHDQIWYEDSEDSYNVRLDANDIFGFWTSDFATQEWTSFGINKFTGEIFAWGWDELGNQFNKNSNENKGWQYVRYPTFFSRTKAPGVKFEKIFTGLNSTSYFNGNSKSPVGWDNPVVAIDVDGNLYAWGVIDGVIVDYPMPIGEGFKWLDVAIADNIMAIREDGLLFEIGTEIPISTSKIQTDSDGDGVPDIDDPFPWDPNAYLDSDADGAADNWEESWMNTDPENPDTDGDGYLDGEDQLPNDPLYHADNDWDGLPDELDPDDNDWDVDDDGARDGDDADFYDDDPNYINPDRKWDCDRDGQTDEEEWERGSDACKLDTDDDGVEDKLDAFPRSYYYSEDSDGDGLPNQLEIINETDPYDEDSDDDGYIDGIAQSTERTIRATLNSLDCDIDCNHYEYFWRFWDFNRDCNGDGQVTQDEWENESEECLYGTNQRDMFPNDPEAFKNSDWDDLHDGIDDDDDNDGVKDEDEIRLGTNPLRWDSKPQDSDGDNVPDVIEEENGLDPFNRDSDGDGAWDGWDSWPSDPSLRHDRDLDKIEDWTEEEYYGTDPDNPDTDGDGLNDKDDPFPLDARYTKDSDEDGLADALETELGYNPNDIDSDGDGYYDAPCNPDKLVYWTDEYGNSWWDRNWRECEGYWERVDTDGDGLWNDEDDDIDGDGILNEDDNDHYDWWRFNESQWIGDAFPSDPNEWEDTDGDGIGNNADEDDDNDGVLDNEDDYPLDARYKLNTDKPTLENGGLKDWNNNGIFGEDYGNDGWIDEMDHRHFDFLPDEIDPDDDGDLFLDEDEIYNGTDPLDSKDFPGIGFTDTDQDGLSNNYEERVSGSDPNNWDTDGDGVSDGWRYPGRYWEDDFKIYIEVSSASATTVANQEYYIEFHGHNQPWEDRIRFEYKSAVEITANELLNYFSNKINEVGGVYHDNSNQFETLSSEVVSGTRLIISGQDNNRNFHYEAFNTVVDNGKLHVYRHDHDSHSWKEGFYKRRNTEWWHDTQYYFNGKGSWNEEHPYLIDAFPNDPSEFWDTDGDGIGDKSDDDIDGDGLSNSVDQNPYFAANTDFTDTDEDGVPNYLDQDDDNDGWLDIDEDAIGSDPLNNSSQPGGAGDSDRDGLSDEYELNVSNTDPNNWDSDGDGIADGGRFPGYDWHYRNNFTEVVEIPSATASVTVGQTYEIYIEGHNPGGCYDDNGIQRHISYTVTQTITGTELLEKLKYLIDTFNGSIEDNTYEISYDQCQNSEVINLEIDGKRLLLRGNDKDRNFHFNAFSTVLSSDGLIYKLNNNWNQWNLGEIYYQDRNTDWCCNEYRIGNGRINWDEEETLYDMFPNDPDKFWDTDNDGIDDFNDGDIDGDGYENEIDLMPYFSSESNSDNDSDGTPDEIDENDDNDQFLDEDEIAVGTDPLSYGGWDSEDDYDRDGLSNERELQIGTDPNNWDSDGDGISDGWRWPGYDWNERDNWKLIIEIADVTAVVNPGEKFNLRLEGNNQRWEDRIEINYTVSGTITGLDLLNHFKDELNSYDGVLYDNSGNTETYTAYIDGRRLVIEGDDKDRNFWMAAFNTVTENGIIYKLNDNWDNWNLAEFYYQQRNTEWCCNEYRYNNGRPGGNNFSPFFRDMFPLDADKYWDTDGDGIDDFSDDDIDGDGVSNSNDGAPYDPNNSIDTDNDSRGDNEDSDDDNDGFLDFDEEYNGTDPKDRDSCPGCYDIDEDRDGLSYDYELILGTDPTLWDTDGDGISDGYRYPGFDWEQQTFNLVIEVADPNATLEIGEIYRIRLHGNDSDWNDRIEIEYEVTNTTTAGELLNYFAERLNQSGGIYYERRAKFQEFTVSVDNRRLIIAGNERERRFHLEAFTTVTDNGVMYKIDDQYRQWQLGELYYVERNPEWCCNEYRINNGEIRWDQTYPYLIDAFPLDPNEYFDTDGDGIGDFSDSDIDGDGYSNSIDQVPYDSRDYLDTDKDGIPDSIDPNKDNDNFLDIDEIGNGTDPLVFTPEDGGLDTDKDGISDPYELSRGSDPETWDTDEDGVSDGWRYPSTCDHFEWFDGSTWKDEFFRERSFDCGENWYYFREGRVVWNIEDGGSVFMDMFPEDENEYWDTDGDGIGDNTDEDIDGDGVSNEKELTPRSNGYTYWDEYTRRGVRSNPFDPDSDDDGFNDKEDEAPMDDKSIKDTDGDGQGDQSDNDIDGDGISNVQEEKLGLDLKNWDSDGDGYSDGDCLPGWEHRDVNNNWRKGFTFTGSSTFAGDYLKIDFKIHSESWENREEIEIFIDELLTPEQLALRVKENIDNYPFPSRFSEFTTTVSGSTVILTGYNSDGINGETFVFPSDAEDWAGVANQNWGLYPMSFPNGGKIRFRAKAAEAVNLYMRFERMPHPDVDPAFDTEQVTVQGVDEWTEYTIEIPPQASENTYSSLILYLTERDKEVTVENWDSFKVYAYEVSNTDSSTSEVLLGNAEWGSQTFGGFSVYHKSPEHSNFYLHPDRMETNLRVFWNSDCSYLNRDEFNDNPDEWKDFDHDNIGDNEDTDDDNDGLNDIKENQIGTNPRAWDTDKDDQSDYHDKFPLDPLKAEDWDNDQIVDWVVKDGQGNIVNFRYRHKVEQEPELGYYLEYVDEDTDNDGMPNEVEDLLNNNQERQENGWDQMIYHRWWNQNTDIDGDGYMDGEDAYPREGRFHGDLDGDNHPDLWDPDIDGDGFRNKDEESNGTDPRDPESFPTGDTDGDKVSDKYELIIKTDLANRDSDGDGYEDNVDDYPLNINEWSDFNNNNEPDNLDRNDDDDRLPDFVEIWLGLNEKSPGTQHWDYFAPSDDPDYDAVPTDLENERGSNPEEGDTDHDGCWDDWDMMPNNPDGCDDLDGDDIPDHMDDDMDGDGLLNWQESNNFVRSDQRYPDSDGDGVVDGEDYVPMDKRIKAKEDINSSLFSFNQVGNNTWKAISSWNFYLQAGTYAGVDSSGDLYFWGTNFGGMPIIPDSETEERWKNGEDYSYPIFEPTPYVSEHKFIDVSLGKKFGIAVTDNGEILSWGTNLSSQLAKGNISTFERPSYPNTSIENVTLLTAGDQQAGAINIDGKLRMFGSNDSGQLGTAATNPNTPQELSWDGIENIKKIIVTESETQILTENGDLWGFGDNTFAQLGRGYRSIRADDYTHKKSIYGDWEDIFANSGNFYGFKKTDGSFWVWGKNDKYDLGTGTKSAFEIDPVKIEGINLNNIKDFTVTRGGYAYITDDGELFGAGENFYSGGWIPLRNPRRIGTDTDWERFFDASGGKINILVQKQDGSIWGAGANWHGQLGQPCPENYTKIVAVDFTHPQVNEIIKLTLTQQNTEVDYLLSINSNIVSLTASDSISFVNELKSLIESDTTINDLITVEIENSSDIENEGSNIYFEAKNLIDLNVSISYSATDSNVIDLTGIVSHSLFTIEDPKFGTATYTLILNGNRIEAAGDSSESARNNMQVALNNDSNVNNGEFNFTISNSLLLVENVHYNEFSVRGEVLNSTFSYGEISFNDIQEREYVECNESWLNDLYMLFDSNNQISDMSMGLFHTIILMNDGTIRSMGADNFGQLGRDGDWRIDEQIGDQSNWVRIKASERVSFAINSDGEMYAWGNNNYGQLGVGDFSTKQVPTLVVSEIESNTIDWSGNGRNLGGFDFQIAVDNNGNAYGWGYKKFGKLGALGKLKADVVGWDVDDTQMDGLVDFDQETDYLIASQELVDNINQIDFENYNDETNTGKGNKSNRRIKGKFDPDGHKTNRTVYRTDPNNSKKVRGGNNTGAGVGKWKVKKTVQAFSGFASISNGEATSANTEFTFSIVDVNERPSDIILSSNELVVESEEDLVVGTIEVIDPDIDDEITVSLSPSSQNQEIFLIDERGLSIVYSDLVDGSYNIIIRATDFEGLTLEKAFIISIINNAINNIEEVEDEEDDFDEIINNGPPYNPRFADTDGDGVTDYIELLAGTDYRDFEDYPTDTDNDGIWDFEDGDLDNDGVLNENDAFPNDPTESLDSDGDGIGDSTDTDNDNDGVPDVDVSWSDSSFVFDQFPNDPNESGDFDHDGIGDNADDDDDNDGVNDELDAFPLNALEWADTDRDNIGDNTDEDIDGDGYLNIYEEQAGSDPYVASSVPEDLDGDLFPDILDLDIDGDGILNEFDTAPNFANPNQEYVPNDPNYIEIEATQFFSPNGDGINDTWIFPEIQRFPLNQVWVYSSDGELVFSQQSYQNDWGGDYNGSILPVGSYLYMVDVDGNGTIDFEGWLYLSN